jgi:hypothetical protein
VCRGGFTAIRTYYITNWSKSTINTGVTVRGGILHKSKSEKPDNIWSRRIKSYCTKEVVNIRKSPVEATSCASKYDFLRLPKS